jgi:hypothetical protein
LGSLSQNVLADEQSYALVLRKRGRRRAYPILSAKWRATPRRGMPASTPLPCSVPASSRFCNFRHGCYARAFRAWSPAATTVTNR